MAFISEGAGRGGGVPNSGKQILDDKLFSKIFFFPEIPIEGILRKCYLRHSEC